MVELDFKDIDWLHIRQALSLSLLKNRAVAVRHGAAFLEGSPEYQPLFNDLALAVAAIGAGRLTLEGDDIIYEPLLLPPGRYRLDTGPRSSAVELLLFLMPALHHGDFRSVLRLSGVTHSVLSYPTTFVKQTLLTVLERLGFYGSLTLKRFGFYGSGGGSMESRIYPQEPGHSPAFAGEHNRSVSGVRIFISRLDARLAELEKRLLSVELELDTGRISIIEVQDSDGIGNSVQVFVDCGGLPVVLFREMNLYGEGEGIIMSENDLRAQLAGLALETRELIMGETLPGRLMREIYPYLILTGNDGGLGGQACQGTITGDLCGRFL